MHSGQIYTLLQDGSSAENRKRADPAGRALVYDKLMLLWFPGSMAEQIG